MRCPTSLLLSALALAFPAVAQGDVLTLGSTLTGEANVVQAHGADTAFWLASLDGQSVSVPEAGQVVEVRIKGAAMREDGASTDPATLVHFQTLGPAGADGSRTVYLTSAGAQMPVDTPGAISTFRPENLCVQAGGAVAFNTIGGFRWGGSFDAPPSDHYLNGTPWRIFSARPAGTATAWFTRDGGTENGDTLTPNGSSHGGSGNGAVADGTELLMQVVVATGADRSQSCGGGSASAPVTGSSQPYVKVARADGRPQRPYVTRDRRFRVGIYCGADKAGGCRGTATVRLAGRRVARGSFRIARRTTGRVAMRLTRAAFGRVDRAGALRITLVIRSGFGPLRTRLTLVR